MIDLHTHTNASDGLLSPTNLVERLHAAGIRTFSITDHDTVAGLDDARRAAADHGMELLPGIEITARDGDREVHVLGYGIDPTSPVLASFLAAQRDARRHRIHRVLERLRDHGLPVDEELVLGAAPPGSSRAIGRPHVARAMVAAGHVSSVERAFDEWLGRDRPAYVPRDGAPPSQVVTLIGRAGGVACLAHPGVTRRDALIPALVNCGLTGLEVWHSDHDQETSVRYLALASDFELVPTGGSDFHGDGADRRCRLGEVSTPEWAYRDLVARLARVAK